MIQSTPLGPVDGQASCLMMRMRCAAIRCYGRACRPWPETMTTPPTAWAGLPIWLVPTAGKGSAWSATRRLLNENGPSLGAERWGRHFLPVCLHDPPGAMDSTLGSTGGSKEPAPDASWLARRLSALCSLLDRHCRLFPLIFGMPDGYPLLRPAIWNGNTL